jgi:hypothetical protein
VFTRSANPRALSPATLASLAGQLGATGRSRSSPIPLAPVERARALAGPGGASWRPARSTSWPTSSPRRASADERDVRAPGRAQAERDVNDRGPRCCS